MCNLEFIQGNDKQAFVDEAYDLFCANRQTPWSLNSFQLSLNNELSTLVCVNAKFAGFVVVSSVLDHAEIEDICVLNSKRNQGIAFHLLRFVIDNAVTQGINEVFLEVAEDNSSAIALYKKFGFYQIGRRKGYYPSSGQDRTELSKNIDALLLQKSLA